MIFPSNLSGYFRFGHTFVLLLLFFSPHLSWCFSVDPSEIRKSSMRAAPDALSDLQEGLLPGQTGYMKISGLFTPSSESITQKNVLGDHYGYPFRQVLQLAVLQSDTKRSAWGASYFYRRSGWEQEDFFLWRPETQWSEAWSMHLAGLHWSWRPLQVLLGGGASWTSSLHTSVASSGKQPEDHLQGWFSAYWFMGGSSVLFSDSLESLQLSLELQNRPVRTGLEESLWNWAPDLYLKYDARQNKRWDLRWKQNLLFQKVYLNLYGNLSVGELESAVLSLYLDHSQFFSLEVAESERNGKWESGFALRMPLLRLAWNHPEDARNYWGEGRKLVVEFRFDLGTIDNRKFFVPGAPRAAKEESYKVDIVKRQRRLLDKMPQESDKVLGEEK